MISYTVSTYPTYKFTRFSYLGLSIMILSHKETELNLNNIKDLDILVETPEGADTIKVMRTIDRENIVNFFNSNKVKELA